MSEAQAPKNKGMERVKGLDLYLLLEVELEADTKTIKKAYRCRRVQLYLVSTWCTLRTTDTLCFKGFKAASCSYVCYVLLYLVYSEYLVTPGVSQEKGPHLSPGQEPWG